jgi:hypothetical protein
MSNTPSDAEIDALWADHGLTVPQIVQRRAIARAVLAKAVLADYINEQVAKGGQYGADTRSD